MQIFNKDSHFWKLPRWYVDPSPQLEMRFLRQTRLTPPILVLVVPPSSLCAIYVTSTWLTRNFKEF